jgi:tetratricopeptide (TPR) repeat protein
MRGVHGCGVVLLVLCLSQGGLAAETPARQASPSPAQRHIEAAHKAIEAKPDYLAYNELAMALARRARETSDSTYYDRSEKALQQSFRLAPDNFEGRKIQVWVLLGKHDFAQARTVARALNETMPDDVQVYGLLVDANAELGDYDAAESAAQWMLDLRPGNVPALTRAAYLREMFGDIDGALELMGSAYGRTPQTEAEDRAWILTQVGHLHLSVGRVDLANSALDQALALFPGYHYALGQLARVRSAQGKWEEAIALLERRYQQAPHAENLFALAQALARGGHAEQANAAFAEFERRSRAEMLSTDNSNRELVFYYIDYASRPPEALSIAQAEMGRRRDIFTLDAYAWALAGNGREHDARIEIERALAIGIKDADVYYHAGIIAAKQRDYAAARKYLRQCLEISAVSEHAATAADALQRLQ